MPTISHKITLTSSLDDFPDWAVNLEDDNGNSFTAYGYSYDEVWGKVADVENFDIPSTVCTISQRVPKGEVFGEVEKVWEEYEVMYGNDSEALINHMTMNNFDPKDVL